MNIHKTSYTWPQNGNNTANSLSDVAIMATTQLMSDVVLIDSPQTGIGSLMFRCCYNGNNTANV